MTPLEHVHSDTLGCLWDTPRYFFFSNEVDQIIYYSHFLPVLAILFLVTVLLFSPRKTREMVLLIVTSILFVAYALINVLLWAISDPSQIMFFWSVTNYIEPLIYFTVFYLVLSFAFKEDITHKIKITLGLLYVPIIIFGPTTLNLTGYDYSNCDRLAVEGPLVMYIYILEVALVIWMFLAAMIAYRKETLPKHKKSILLLTIGSILFLFAFSFGNIFGTLFQNILGERAWIIGQYGLFGMPIFLGFITYMIVKYEAFNTKLIGVQALMLSLVVLVASLLFVAQSDITRIVAGFTLFLVTIFGISLVRGVKQEIMQREEIERLAKGLSRANERLKELDRMKSEFVSIASHQLRSPLTSIRGYASMLTEGSYGKIPAKAAEVIDRIGESARFMATSVEDYLNVSRIESGNMKYEMSDFNLKVVAERIVDDMRPIAIKKGLVLIFRSDCDGSCMIHADIGKTRQIIMNLLDNSMKYTPHGSITVVAHDDVKNKKMYLSISDTGVGINPAVIDDLFEKFIRAKNANCVNVTGTGLGLYVVKKMIVAMGGSVSVFSEGEGKGTTFKLEFPLVPGKAPGR